MIGHSPLLKIKIKNKNKPRPVNPALKARQCSWALHFSGLDVLGYGLASLGLFGSLSLSLFLSFCFFVFFFIKGLDINLRDKNIELN